MRIYDYKTPTCHPECPKTSPRRPQTGPRDPKKRPKATQNDPKSGLRAIKKRSQTARRKKDRPKTIPRPSWTAHAWICLVKPPSRAPTWEPKTTPKPTPKRSKIEVKNQDEKEAIQDDLGPVLGRSWVDLGPILGSILVQKY